MQQHFSNLEKITIYIRKRILFQGNYHLEKNNIATMYLVCLIDFNIALFWCIFVAPSWSSLPSYSN
jgi:hypothetical protein